MNSPHCIPLLLNLFFTLLFPLVFVWLTHRISCNHHCTVTGQTSYEFSHASPGSLTCELSTIHSTRAYCSSLTSVSFGVTLHCVCAPAQVYWPFRNSAANWGEFQIKISPFSVSKKFISVVTKHEKILKRIDCNCSLFCLRMPRTNNSVFG